MLNAGAVCALARLTLSLQIDFLPGWVIGFAAFEGEVCADNLTAVLFWRLGAGDRVGLKSLVEGLR